MTGRWMALALAALLIPVTGSASDAPAGKDKAAKERLVISIPPPPARIIKGVGSPPLRETRFQVGDTLSLDRPFDPAAQAPEGCIDKPGLGARFCMDPVSWPAPILAALEMDEDDETIYRGARAVIRYDRGQVSQAHVMFPTSAFIDVVEHLTASYGQPTEQEITVRPVPGDLEIANTIVRWKSIFADADEPVVLEVRAFDDVRHVSPDRQHGFLWLHREGATPVFRHFTTVDLMLLRQRRLGQWPADEDAGD